MDNKRNINLIALGDAAVGKTSIIKGIKDGKFQEVYEMTIRTDFYVLRRKYEKKNYDEIGFLQYIRPRNIGILCCCELYS